MCLFSIGLFYTGNNRAIPCEARRNLILVAQLRKRDELSQRIFLGLISGHLPSQMLSWITLMIPMRLVCMPAPPHQQTLQMHIYKPPADGSYSQSFERDIWKPQTSKSSHYSHQNPAFKIMLVLDQVTLTDKMAADSKALK